MSNCYLNARFRSFQSRTFPLCLLVVTFLSSRALGAGVAYTLRDLGTASGSYIASINAHGDVAFLDGSSAVCFSDNLGRAVVAPDTNWSTVSRINVRGEITGLAGDFRTGVYPALYRPREAVINLLPPGTHGNQISGAFGLSDSGTVVGRVAEDAFRYDSNIGSRLMSEANGLINHNVATAVNDSGRVVGLTETSPGEPQHPAEFFSDGPPVLLLSVNGQAEAVSNSGFVAGRMLGRGGEHLFRLNATGGLTDVPFGASDGYVGDVNDSGDVAGIIGGYASTISRACVYSDADGLLDLNQSADVPAGWHLISAGGINNSGQIAGIGILNGERHAYRLTPVVPEPASVSLLALGLIGIAGNVRRRPR